ncbi:hypothetical protein B0J13DRAFT_322628 [Dactylonectria estremocensis]|uniref:2EXR domain-containing protein n=1 Tax=Dactylonectria estremocensis TaxID=1079267 RepID=A0A9P9J3B9_9HYPO|nr:hypothetical protein B0J13DRAFT_322628 [Dactylonectria estremocensis]
MADSTGYTISAVSESFLRFPDLPTEVRFRIWEFSLPYRDVKIGCASASASSVSASTNNRLDRDLDKEPHLRPPKIISHVCRESREVALASGVFFRAGCKDALWIDNETRVVYLSTKAVELPPSSSLPKSIHALACLWPTIKDLNVFQDFLLKRSEERVNSPTKIMYAGISAIVYDNTDNNAGPYPLYDESNISVFGLDDPRLPAFLQSAFEAAEGRYVSGLYHRSPSCFLKNLKRYWETESRAQELQTYWNTVAWECPQNDAASASISQQQHQRRHLPELKPAVIFGKTKKQLFFGVSGNTRAYERGCGLLFTKTDVHSLKCRGGSALWFSRVNTRFDCENACGM